MNEDQQFAIREAVWWALKDDSEGVLQALRDDFTATEVLELHQQLYAGDLLNPIHLAVETIVQIVVKGG